ncbi:MAG: alkaline phosphatase D family protein [Panacagrimonas sp.]
MNQPAIKVRGAPQRRPSLARSRRDFLLSAGSVGLVACAARAPIPHPAPSLATDPFTLGVASGDPRTGGFVIWTRLAPDPLVDNDDAGDPDSPIVVSEFVGSSISSRGVPQDLFEAMRPDNPHVKFFDSTHRGYVLCELNPKHWRSDFRALDDVRDASTSVRTLASFVVESGRPGVQAA